MSAIQPTRRAMAALLLLGPALATTPVAAAPKAQKARKPSGPAPRTPFTEADQLAARISGIPEARFFADSASDFQAAVEGADGAWLALSSGGEDGAFGAGLLTGLSAAGRRPDFAVVTGSSTGALMAPYAFLGPKYDDVLRESYTSINAGDVFEAAATPESMFDTWPLQKLIEKSVSAELLDEIAAEHRRGRRLFVMTTNLDAGRPVAWNMGAIAASGEPHALKLFRDVLLASSSIPGFFPPVYVDVEANGKTFNEMHADGSIRFPFYVGPESLLADTAARSLAGRQFYIIVNGKLDIDLQVVERSTPGVLGRSICLALKTGTRSEIMRVVAAARRQGADIQVSVVPSDFDRQARGTFDPEYMQALFALGASRAQAGRAFGTDLAALGLPVGG